jgi:hypothetical protein
LGFGERDLRTEGEREMGERGRERERERLAVGGVDGGEDGLCFFECHGAACEEGMEKGAVAGVVGRGVHIKLNTRG